MPTIRPGRNSANASPTPTDNWLPLYGGEVITAYEEENWISEMVNSKSISNGNSHEFPATWKMDAEYHQQGVELLGMDTETRKYVITCDERPLVSHFEVDDIDSMFAHYETRSEFSSQCGIALARRDQENILRLLILASRMPKGNSTNFPGGGNDGNGGALTNSAFANEDETAASALLDAIDSVVVRWADADLNIPMNDRWCIVRPGLFQKLRRLGTLTGASNGQVPLIGHADIDTVNPRIQQGLTRGQVIQWNGVNITWSSRLAAIAVDAKQGTAAGAKLSSKYWGDYQKTKAIMFQRDAIGHLSVLAPTTETERSVRRGVDFSKTAMLTGGGTLRPYCSVEIAVP